MRIADIPLVERPLAELLHFDDERTDVDRNYAGYGWSLASRLWLADRGGPILELQDVLLVGVHSADDAGPVDDNIELEFELPDHRPVGVLATTFFEVWLPKLPKREHTVLALCNPHRAVFKEQQWTGTVVHYALGNVESWIDDDKDGRIELVADGSWVSFHS